MVPVLRSLAGRPYALIVKSLNFQTLVWMQAFTFSFVYSLIETVGLVMDRLLDLLRTLMMKLELVVLVVMVML